MDNRVKGLLGLSRRAGMLVPGTDKAVKAVQGGKAALLLLDGEASANTRKLAQDKCLFHRVKLVELEGGELDAAIGSNGVMVAAVLKGTLADRILEMV